MSTLDISPYANAVEQLERGLEEADANPTSELNRDGVIQRFEYTYEMAKKMIKRVFETQFGEDADKMILKDFFRTAFERGLIEDPAKWYEYNDARNKTSHIYDEEVAIVVYAFAKHFLPDARFLLKQLDRYATH